MSTQQEAKVARKADVRAITVCHSAAAFLAEADRAHERWEERGVALTLIEAMPIYFLYGQAIELMFKAFLRARGYTDRDLSRRPFGHDVVELYRECRKNLLFTDQHCLSMIGIIAEHYSLADWHIRFKYISDVEERFPTFAAVSVFSHALLEAIRPVCDGMDPLVAAMQVIQSTQPHHSEWWSVEKPFSPGEF